MQTPADMHDIPVHRQKTGFFAWWIRELRGIFASPPRPGFVHPKRRIVAAAGDGGVRWFDETDQSLKPLGPRSPSEDTDPATLKIVQRLAGRRRAVPVGLRIAKRACFERRIELPEAARPDIARILELDLERATPFKHKDVYTAFYEDRQVAVPTKGKIAVCQLIVKRERIDDPRRNLRAQGIDPVFADCWNDSESAPLPVDFLAKPAEAREPAQRPQTLAKLMALIALVLAGSAAGLAIQRGNEAIGALEAKIAEAKARAQSIRKSVDQAEAVLQGAAALRNLKDNRLPIPAIIEELTRLLPDTTFVVDLRIDGGRIALTGLSQSAAALVPEIEKSDMFEGAAMAAPILFDASAGKEQFRIEARLTGIPDKKPGEETAP